MSGANDQIESFISDWIVTGRSELANTQSFVNGLAALIGNLAFQCGAIAVFNGHVAIQY
jgi:hypothetical protein